MRKPLKILLALLIMASFAATVSGCRKAESTTGAESQVFTVKRGDLTLEITAAGNLALSRTQDIAIELFYPAGTKGTVESVLVEEGDSVKEGQVLLTLDGDEWEDQLRVLKKALDSARRNVITKTTQVKDAEIELAALKRQVAARENAVAKAQYQVKVKELALSQAELNVQTANATLYNILEVKKAKDAVDQADETLEFINRVLSGIRGGGLSVADVSYWYNLREVTKQELKEAQQDLEDILEGKKITLDADIVLQIARQKLQVEQYQLALTSARIELADASLAVEEALAAVDEAKHAVAKAEQALENARLDLADAQSALEDAQKDYEKALSMSPEIKAPFDGFVTKVNVAGGDEVLKGTIAIQIADPNRFEANILVSEMDIAKVKIGGQAMVTADALPGMAFPAKVTHIAPTATIQSGVVNYTVKVELEELTAPNQPATANATATLPPMLQRAVESGRMTLEQAEALAKNRPSGGFMPSANATPGGMGVTGVFGAPGASRMQGSAQLRQGLSVTVSIIVDSRTNVLLVPNGAITTEGFSRYVEVITESGAIEKRAVKTGLSNWQYTEITEGLTEGEKVKVTLGTSTSTSSSQRPPQMFFGPGPGGRR